MKSNPFKLKKNKRYNYTPRYYKGKDSVNIYDFDSNISRYASTYNKNDFGNTWNNTREKMRSRSNGSFSLTLLVIILILISIFLYIIDFDLTIFKKF
ncbi:MAG: hypothetical protein CMC21_04705 [Flavobacteriaceae bacterium]|nr:hypothetical protein [Flavobacteriaceae bacterium]